MAASEILSLTMGAKTVKVTGYLWHGKAYLGVRYDVTVNDSLESGNLDWTGVLGVVGAMLHEHMKATEDANREKALNETSTPP